MSGDSWERRRARHRRGGRLPLLALWLLWLLLLLAAARPVWIGEPMELPNSGRDLMLAVDISGSMRIEDMQVGQSLVRVSTRSNRWARSSSAAAAATGWA